MPADHFWEKMSECSVQEVTVAGRAVRPGSRVRLAPLPGGDLLDRALRGRIGVVEGIDEDDGGVPHVAVTLEDAPGRDLAQARHPAHRFFFLPEELEPLDERVEPRGRRVLVAGIGNVFLGDDGFGVAVAQRLMRVPLPPGVEVADYGIRGMDLAYALGAGYHAAILVDAVPQGKAPGSVCIIDPRDDGAETGALDSHQMDPRAVLGLARRLGELPAELLIVGCEPGRIPDPLNPDPMSMELSPQVEAAVEGAAGLVVQLAARMVCGCR